MDRLLLVNTKFAGHTLVSFPDHVAKNGLGTRLDPPLRIIDWQPDFLTTFGALKVVLLTLIWTIHSRQ